MSLNELPVRPTLRPSICPPVRLSVCPFGRGVGHYIVMNAAGIAKLPRMTWLIFRLCHAPYASYRPHFINTFANTPRPRPCPVWVNYAKKPIKPACLYKGLAVTLSCPLPAMDTTKWRLTKSEVMCRNEGDMRYC